MRTQERKRSWTAGWGGVVRAAWWWLAVDGPKRWFGRRRRWGCDRPGLLVRRDGGRHGDRQGAGEGTGLVLAASEHAFAHVARSPRARTAGRRRPVPRVRPLRRDDADVS